MSRTVSYMQTMALNGRRCHAPRARAEPAAAPVRLLLLALAACCLLNMGAAQQQQQEPHSPAASQSEQQQQCNAAAQRCNTACRDKSTSVNSFSCSTSSGAQGTGTRVECACEDGTRPDAGGDAGQAPAGQQQNAAVGADGGAGGALCKGMVGRAAVVAMVAATMMIWCMEPVWV